jgi:hypothetical protein
MLTASVRTREGGFGRRALLQEQLAFCVEQEDGEGAVEEA